MAGRDVHYLAAHTRMGYPKSGRNHARPAQRFSSRPHVYTRTARCQIEGSTMDAKTDAKKKTGTITVGNKNWDFPVYDGTIGPEVLDIAKLYNESGMFTYDPGFTSTASCESKITYIDGDLGVLLYRGYPIDQLAEHGDFLETCYLLLYGELPTPQQKHDFDYRVTRHTMVHEQMARFFQGFRRDAHPMAVMTGCIGALSAFYHDSTDISDPHQRMIASLRMIAKVPTLAAMAYKYSIGQPFVYPKNELDYASNFLRMCYAVPAEDYKVNAVLARAMDRIFILHADHEQNASTSTVRLAGSSGANPFACIAAGCACLWGPAHGGANEAALNMLREIGTVDRIPEFIKRAKDKNDSYRLMGFAHRVYKNYDPRAKIMQKTCHEVLAELGIKDDPLLDVAMELEKIALHDDYFLEKKLYPNIDFYSGITLKAMGFPTTMFTVLFAVARTVGWIAQWKEMIEDPHQKIGRPRQLYIDAGPSEAAAEGGEQQFISALQFRLVVPQAERDGGVGGVAVFVDGHHHLFHRQAHALGRRLDDTIVGLVRHQPVDHVGAQIVARHDLGRDFGHLGDGEFIDRGAFLVDVVQALGHRLRARRHAAAAGLLMQMDHAGAVGADQRVHDAIAALARLQQHGAGAVAEQNAGGAIGVVDDRRHLVGAHHHHLARGAVGDEL